MVGMPVFIDQIDVITRMQEKGIGLEVNKGASADSIHAAIVQVTAICIELHQSTDIELWNGD